MNRAWFRPKKYGFGAVPATWEGWAALGVFVATISALAIYASRSAHGFTSQHWIAWSLTIVGCTLAFVLLSWWKTDGEWRFRGGWRGWMN